VQPEGQATVIALTGDVDGEAAHQLRDAAARAAARPCPVVIEMSQVTKLSGPGIGVLVGAWHRLADRLTLRCSPPVHATLVQSGLDRLLPVG
jgi:anti-anti-sigma factor